MIKNPEDSFTGGLWLKLLFSVCCRINNSVSAPPHRTHHSPASWWACGRPVPRSVGGMAHRPCTLWNNVAHRGTMWYTVEQCCAPWISVVHRGTMLCTVEGARLGPNVPSATAVCSAAASIFFYLSIPSQSAVQQHCTTKLPRLVSLKVISPTFLQRHCCCLSQGVKGPCVHLFYQHSGHQSANSPIISDIYKRGTIFYPTLTHWRNI